MTRTQIFASWARALILAGIFSTPALAQALDTFRVSYGGYNETATPMWVGIGTAQENQISGDQANKSTVSLANSSAT